MKFFPVSDDHFTIGWDGKYESVMVYLLWGDSFSVTAKIVHRRPIKRKGKWMIHCQGYVELRGTTVSEHGNRVFTT